MMLSAAEYEKIIAQGYTYVPVVKTLSIKPSEAHAIDIYRRLAGQAHSYLFESISHNRQWGRYSIIGLPCEQHIHIAGKTIQWHKPQGVETIHCDNPLHWLERHLADRRMPDHKDLPGGKNLPPFLGGLVGFFGYDTVRYIEPVLPAAKPAVLDIPDIFLLVSTQLLIVDHYDNCLHIIVCACRHEKDAWHNACPRISEIEASLQAQTSQPLPTMTQTPGEVDFVSSFGEDAYKQAVERARDYICRGEVMQLVLSQCLRTPFTGHPMALYKRLVQVNPSPYMFYLHLGNFHVVGSSPEILVRAGRRQLTVRPIAGTRKRGKTKAEDCALENELLADKKELAEHLMLIDLGRNDLGRVCKTGSVKVSEQMIVERYSHVMHIVSHVNGERPKKTTCLDILRATFPAGTVSGAPKVRAMELIDELEPIKRQVYSGAIGYLSWSGFMDTAIAIRTAVICDGQLYLQAGAGIVYDSVPENEWEETLNKARAMMQVVGGA